ncbi:MAG TPA: redox-sensing transcriptional repressor Rex [Bacteroidales bacterium]|nr:redox-sensing transcriptional repressor Rex [Bacteroidales bacterium]
MLPEKTIERLSQYRRLLTQLHHEGRDYIFSHDIALLLHITSVQVRRDIMLIGYTGSQRKGYIVVDMISKIGEILDAPKGLRAAVFGMGNLGKAITSYFNGTGHNISIVAAFDSDIQKNDRLISGIPCHSIQEIKSVILNQKISLAILTLPPQFAQEITDNLVFAGIKGILNFTSVPLRVSPDVFVENYDMLSSLEKIAYFVKEIHKDSIV